MGCWKKPETAGEKQRLWELARELDAFQDKLYNLFGDDELFDLVGAAQSMMEQQAATLTESEAGGMVKLDTALVEMAKQNWTKKPNMTAEYMRRNPPPLSPYMDDDEEGPK